tara:strand:+ start:192 stop:446 length:255 start_codon:yes stop_codon:yes gene_type:complete
MELASIWLAIILMYNVGGNPNVSVYKTASAGPFETYEACAMNAKNIGIPAINAMNQSQGYKIVDVYCMSVNEDDSVKDFGGPST